MAVDSQRQGLRGGGLDDTGAVIGEKARLQLFQAIEKYRVYEYCNNEAWKEKFVGVAGRTI